MTRNEQYEREATAQEAAEQAIGDTIDKHIYEGWTVRDFIEALKPKLDLIMTGRSWRKLFKTRKALETWCADNQPQYKEPLREVATYFSVLYGIGRSGRSGNKTGERRM
ncbi:MAG: hypothetical protein IJ587_01990 [Synergistaceae bacterium]|nr:hypothetical protein [Synergistaceae bacterium]